jgi:hypothetical protein
MDPRHPTDEVIEALNDDREVLPEFEEAVLAGCDAFDVDHFFIATDIAAARQALLDLSDN